MITYDYNEFANNYELIERFGCVRKLDGVLVCLDIIAVQCLHCALIFSDASLGEMKFSKIGGSDMFDPLSIITLHIHCTKI